MSSPSSLLILLLTLLLLTQTTLSSPRPKALVAPVSKDPTTSQYILHLHHSVPIDLVLHLGGRDTWLPCTTPNASSPFRLVRCRTAACALANSHACDVTNNVCGSFPENPFTSTSTSGDLAQGTLSLSSTDGSNPGPLVSDSDFIFTCAPSSLLDGLARRAAGVAALGRGRVGLPLQLAAAFSFDRSFALCLTSSETADGVVFFGDGPYRLLPNTDASQVLLYTPLLVNPVSTAGTYSQGERSVEYFVGVRSIKVDGKAVPLNASLLTIRSDGFGGTKISTVQRYTSLQTSIYRAVLKAFGDATAGIRRVEPVAPFGLCLDPSQIAPTRVGLAVPTIDLVFQSESVYWRIWGANSMVSVSDGAVCLGFVDGGEEPRTAIVIGGHQIEDNLLQFDIARSRLGFSSTLLFRQTTCGNFNFTSSS